MAKKLETRNSRLATTLHSIRLRHPWQCESDGDTYRWSRKFNWPAELSPKERIMLVITPTDTAIAVQLNETALATDVETQDVTDTISHHNLLTLTHSEPPTEDPRQLPFDVRLDIIVD